ncbi:MAG: hypothetical protein M3408_01105 [Actinomycetota bacterium]|nr:hypothetical protein [Actinomycetota bacterium]
MNLTPVDELADGFGTQPRDRLMVEEAEGNACSPPASGDETRYAAGSTWLGKFTRRTDSHPRQARATPVARRATTAARTAALVAGLMLLLAGCVTSGTVTEKSSDLGRVSCSFDPLDCDHTGGCWRLHLEDAQGRTGRVCVPVEDWLLTDVGDYYDGPTVIQ